MSTRPDKGVSSLRADRATRASPRASKAVSAIRRVSTNAAQVETWMLANNVREVRWVPTPALGQGTFHWDVLLRGGGPSGIGDSIAEALERAREANAERLDAA